MKRAGLTLAAVILTSYAGTMVSAGAVDGGTRVPCATEDGPGPCVWDARHMGNGEGRSFVVRASGRVVYVSHARAHCLLTGKGC